MSAYGVLQYRPYTQARRGPAAPQRPRDPLQLLSAALGGQRNLSPLMTMPVGPGDSQGPHPPYTQPPAAPPPADTGGTGGSGGSGTGNASGYENDPILQQIKALAASNITSAEAAATAGRKRLAVQLGDSGLAKTLGLGDAIANAAQNNPYSILAGLLNNHVGRANGIDQSLNQSNLFFSSKRGTDLGNEGRQYLGERSTAFGSAQDQLAQIAAALLAAKQAAAQMVLQGEGDAYQRGLQNPPNVQPGDQSSQAAAFAALQQLLSNDPSVRSGADTSLLSPSTILRALGG